MNKTIERIVSKYHHDKTRIMDILIDVQSEYKCVSEEAKEQIAKLVNISKADVEQTVSFYHFFSLNPTGKFTIYLNNSVTAEMMGRAKVAEAFEDEAGCNFGSVTADGLIGLFNTSCIGMSDQEPAAIINGRIFPRLAPFRAREIIKDIKAGKTIEELTVEGLGDGKNSSPEIQASVYNNLRKIGPVLSLNYTIGEAVNNVKKLDPEKVIEIVKDSQIRGRGGAGFPTGLKWELCRKADNDKRYVFCNADEGEPGTFKDRVILTERPELLFEGMIVAGYAVGAEEGVLYLRYEYKYLRNYLESVLQKLREANLLGKNIAGKKGFNFDIRIQLGGGAYVCGEESALIESAEGKRGEPRDRPPFPVETGYLEKPTVVNNVETLCSVVKIVNKGADWYNQLGTSESTGTKVISISGDCQFPGVYEVEWGFSVNDILEMVNAPPAKAVQVGGPSGQLIRPFEFNRKLCYEDLATGGSILIFGKHRNLLREVVLNFTNFFIEESCGSCAPCRYLTVILRNKLQKILDGYGLPKDMDDLLDWSKTMKANRCGLGHTAANPIVSSLKNFRYLYEDLIQENKNLESGFNLEEAVKESCEVAGRQPKIM